MEGFRLRVFVIGGTGAIGRQVIPALVQEGHTVTALARTPAKAAALTAQGTLVSVSLFDRSALTAAFADRDAAVNLATAIPPMTRFMSVKGAQRQRSGPHRRLSGRRRRRAIPAPGRAGSPPATALRR
jgi:uncharacterized protein YbjT (DUF2867 family)